MAMYSIRFGVGVLRTTELRPVVQVVPRPSDRREGVRRQYVLEDLVNDCSIMTSRIVFFVSVVAQAKLRRATCQAIISPRRDAPRSVGVAQEFPTQRRATATTTCGSQRRGQLPRPMQDQTYASTTDPEARDGPQVVGDGREAFLFGASVDGAPQRPDRGYRVDPSDRLRRTRHRAEMLARLPATKPRRTVAGDKTYDTRGFVADLRELHITPHLAPNTTRQRSTIDQRTTRHDGQRQSTDPETDRGTLRLDQDHRRRPGTPHIGRPRNRAWFLMTGAVYNILRITALDATPA